MATGRPPRVINTRSPCDSRTHVSSVASSIPNVFTESAPSWREAVFGGSPAPSLGVRYRHVVKHPVFSNPQLPHRKFLIPGRFQPRQKLPVSSFLRGLLCQLLFDMVEDPRTFKRPQPGKILGDPRRVIDRERRPSSQVRALPRHLRVQTGQTPATGKRWWPALPRHTADAERCRRATMPRLYERTAREQQVEIEPRRPASSGRQTGQPRSQGNR